MLTTEPLGRAWGFELKSPLFKSCALSNAQPLSGVMPFPNKPWFLRCLHYQSFENTVGKEEIARNEQFLLFLQCFLPVWRNFLLKSRVKVVVKFEVVVFKIFQVGSLKFVVWEKLNPLPNNPDFS